MWTERMSAFCLWSPPLLLTTQLHNRTTLVYSVVQASGDKALFVWRPVPPSSAFVAMGMVVTTTEEPPSQDSVRCVPRRWVIESTFKPVKVGNVVRFCVLWHPLLAVSLFSSRARVVRLSLVFRNSALLRALFCGIVLHHADP